MGSIEGHTTYGEMHTRLLLSVQRALLGAVPFSLRAVFCGWSESTITLRFISDGEIDPDHLDAGQIAGTEVIADFCSPWTISQEFVRLDAPARIEVEPSMLRAYLRREDGQPSP